MRSLSGLRCESVIVQFPVTPWIVFIVFIVVECVGLGVARIMPFRMRGGEEVSYMCSRKSSTCCEPLYRSG